MRGSGELVCWRFRWCLGILCGGGDGEGRRLKRYSEQRSARKTAGTANAIHSRVVWAASGVGVRSKLRRLSRVFELAACPVFCCDGSPNVTGHELGLARAAADHGGPDDQLEIFALPLFGRIGEGGGE